MGKILILNPNSSEKVTNDMKQIVPQIPEIEYTYYTAPSEAPKEISGSETSKKSEEIVLPDITDKKILDEVDGVLVCCYSDHPLIYSLSNLTKKPVLGIMQASLLASLLDPLINQRIIITSFDAWEPLLDQAIQKFHGLDQFPETFVPTQSLNINVVNLNNPDEFSKIEDRVRHILNQYESVNCVLLGCAGMVGLDIKLSALFSQVKFIDSIKVGCEFLGVLVRHNNTSN